jgi:WD40 repeat protein
MGIAWTADGKSVLDAQSDASDVHLWRVAVSGTPKPERVEAVGSKALLPITSRAGSRLVYVQGDVDMDIQRLELGAPAEGFLLSTRFDSTPQFSPDGTKIAFASSRSGSGEIWVCRRDGSNILQLTKGPGKFQGSPQWSPDGRWITFDSQGQDGHWDIYVVDAAGGQPRQLTRDPSNEQIPSFSRDGYSIYYCSNRSGRVEIWRIPATGGQAVQVTGSGGVVAIESWDGKSVFYSKSALDPGPLFERPSSGGPERRVLDSVVGRAFFPVQNGIYYFGKALDDGVLPLQFFDFATGSVRKLTTIRGQLGWGLTVSPQQRLFLYCVYKLRNDDLMLVENFR